VTGTELLAILGAVAGLAVALCVLLGYFAKFVAVPYLREHLFDPVKETRHQVTVNGHVSRDPTLLDKVDSLQKDNDDIRADLATAARMFEGHIDRSAGEWGRLWSAIRHLEDNRKEPPT
jgi:hypothetical protein